MISRRGQQDGGADSAPALDANLASGHATHPRFDSEPRLASDPGFARRVADMKWLAALLLMATAAILMLDAVWTSLGSGLSVAMAPALFRRAETGGDLQRADRLTPVERNVIRTRIEQLADDGHGTRPFTHVIARLAQASYHLYAPKSPVDKGLGETTLSAATPAAPAAHDSAPAAVAVASAASEALPHEIRFGASRPALPAHASAFAAPDESSPSPTPPGVPINLTVIAKAASAVGAERRIIVARAGDTLDSILTALGATAQDVGAIATLLTPYSLFGRDTFAGASSDMGSATSSCPASDVTAAACGCGAAGT